MDFVHLLFKGRTTSPWHVGMRRFGDYLYTRTDMLWGRGIRGPVLRQLWRTYCPRSDVRDGAPFRPERDCPNCDMADDCPFNNLRGSPDEGEFKDRPRLIITNLEFEGPPRPEVMALVARDERFLGVVPGRGPVYIEYIPPGVRFHFEVILMGDGVRFEGELTQAIKVSLRFLGWGGLCNEGFGRGVIEDTERKGFEEFNREIVDGIADKVEGLERVELEIKPMLILDRPDGTPYMNVLKDKEGFVEKLTNCINERYWQFYRRNIYVPIEDVSGLARPVRIKGWSRKEGKWKEFAGITGELVLEFKRPLGPEEARAVAICRYGVGRYKNQGFGSLRLKMEGRAV